MDVLQAWIVVGVPGLVVAGALFVGRSWLRALLGYATLVALVVTFAMIPAGAPSAVVIGVVGALVLAMGRGTRIDRIRPEHHEGRRRFTTVSG
ncbi:MAG: hypothetical protein WD358_02445 [Nitriliruptoraceae bacterium]